jgi:hypothetical protein
VFKDWTTKDPEHQQYHSDSRRHTF